MADLNNVFITLQNNSILFIFKVYLVRLFLLFHNKFIIIFDLRLQIQQLS